MFWLCDYNNDGKTFILRHMICLDRRVFDPLLHECVLQGTTRLTRNNSFSDTKTDNQKNQFNAKNTTCSQAIMHPNTKNNQKHNKNYSKELPLTIRIHQENSNCRSHVLCYSDEGLRMKCPKHNQNQNICQPKHLILCQHRDRIHENN